MVMDITEANAKECVRGILTGLDYLHERYVKAVMSVALQSLVT